MGGARGGGQGKDLGEGVMQKERDTCDLGRSLCIWHLNIWELQGDIATLNYPKPQEPN